MIKKYLIVILLLTSDFKNVWSQAGALFFDYHILKVNNRLPANFLEDSKERAQRTSKVVSADQTRTNRLSEVRFYEMNGYFSELVRFSGKVLIDDTITSMLNALADKLLIHAPRLRSNISVYSLRSSSVNAFATPDGMIFVNLGLVARLESEDELAFVLSHEIAHVFKQHSLKSYLSKYRLDVNPNEYRAGEKSWEVHSYSQFNEFQADSLGFDLFRKAGYDTKAAQTAMDKLRYAEYPALSEKFDLEKWRRALVYFPSSVKILDCSKRIPDNGDSENSTHPATGERIEHLVELNEGVSATATEKPFWFYKELALFECASLYNDELESFNAVHHCAVMLNVYPDNEFLETELARALYGALLVRNRKNNAKDVIVTGEAERIKELYFYLDKVEAGTMALKLVWDLHLKHPENKDLMYYAFGIMTELSRNCSKQASDYDIDVSEFNAILARSGPIPVGKLDSVAQLWVDANAGEEGENIYKYALAGQKDDSIFNFLFSKAKDAQQYDARGITDVQNFLIGNMSNEGVIAMSPFSFYMNLSRKEGEAINFNMMSRIRKDISESIDQSARRLKLPVTIMNPAITKKSTPDGYNALSVLNDWLYTRLTIDSTVTVMPFSITRISELERTTKSSEVINTGYLQVQQAKSYEGFHLLGLLGGMMVPNLAWTILKPRMAGLFFYQQFNIRSGVVKFEYVKEMNHQVYRSSMVSTHVYYCLRKGSK